MENISDRIIEFASETYFRVEQDDFTKTLDYELLENRIPPFHPNPGVVDITQWNVLSIKDSSQLSRLELLNDSINYLIQIDTDLDLNDYLRLKALIEDNPKIKTEIKRLTTTTN